MVESERDKLLTFLFDRNDKQIRNVKFFRGDARELTIDDMCLTAREVIAEMWATEGNWADDPPISNPR